MTQWDPEDEAADDREDPDESDMDGDEDVAGTQPCPWCGEAIYEHAEYCPRCGKYLTSEGGPPARKPWWILIAVIACIAATLAWVL